MKTKPNCCLDTDAVVSWFEELRSTGSTYESILDELEFDSDQYPDMEVLKRARDITFADQERPL